MKTLMSMKLAPTRTGKTETLGRWLKDTMLKNSLIYLILIAALGTPIVGCSAGRGGSQASPGNSDSHVDSVDGFTVPSATRTTPETDGVSSGGGGYSDENGRRILERVRGELLELVKNTDLPRMKKKLPKNWDLDLIAPLLEKRFLYEPSQTISRDNVDLIFNYGIDLEGKYIVALKPLFIGLIGASIENTQLIDDLKIKVLHEICHHFGVGLTKETDGEARECGQSLYSSLINGFEDEDFKKISEKNLSVLKPRKEGDILTINFSEEIFESCIKQLVKTDQLDSANQSFPYLNDTCRLAQIEKNLMPFSDHQRVRKAIFSKNVDELREEHNLYKSKKVEKIGNDTHTSIDPINFEMWLEDDGTLKVSIGNLLEWNSEQIRRVLNAMSGEIRFYPDSSEDGNTYVLVAKSFKGCNSATLNGKPWVPVPGEKTRIFDGDLDISCESPSRFGVRLPIFRGEIYVLK